VDIARGVHKAPNANRLLSVTDHCLRSRDYDNLGDELRKLDADWRSANHLSVG
jgi:hypothetical protein